MYNLMYFYWVVLELFSQNRYFSAFSGGFRDLAQKGRLYNISIDVKNPKIHQKNQRDLNAKEQPSVDSLVKIRTKCQYETP